MSALVKPNVKIGILVAVVSCVFFGIYPAASRAAYADGANAVFILLLTTFFRAGLLSFHCLRTKTPFFDTPLHRRKALAGGFWLAVSVTGIITSLVYIPGPLVLMIVSMRSLMLFFLMAARKEIKPDFYSLPTTLAALAGLSFVLDIWHSQAVSDWFGIALAFMAAVGTVFQFYVYDGQMKDRPPLAVGAESFTVASLFILPLLFWETPAVPLSLAGWGWAGLSAVSLGIGVFGMFYGIAYLGAFRWSLFAKSETLFAALFSVLFLNEVLKPSQYAGIVAVIASLMIYEILRRKEEEPLVQEELLER